MDQVNHQGFKLEQKKESAIKAIFGHVVSREFWIKLGKDMVEAAFYGFFAALGGVIYKYGTNKGTQQTTPPPDNSMSSKAFGNGYQPSPSYSSNYAPPTPSQGDQRFPGLR
jgi:hypothetical protein